MAHGLGSGEAVTGCELNDIATRQYYETLLSSCIFPVNEYTVDISPHIGISDLQVCRYQNGRITLYVPAALPFTIEQMIDAIRLACKSETLSLPEQLLNMEDDPDAIIKIKNLLNGKPY